MVALRYNNKENPISTFTFNIASLGVILDQVDIGEARGRTPLHYAAQRGATGCIQALLDYQADPNRADKRGATALLLLGGGYLIKGHRKVSG